MERERKRSRVSGTSFLSRFQRYISRLSFSKRLSEASMTGYSKASIDESEIANIDTKRFLTPSGKKDLEIIYRNSWIVFKALNVRANLLTSRGFKIVSKSSQAQKITSEFLKSISPVKPVLALQNYFRELSLNTDIFGSGYWEKLFTPNGAGQENAKGFLGIKPIHPRYLDFIRDQSGKILLDEKTGLPQGWQFKKDDYQESIKIPLSRIAHLTYNKVGDELLGMSTIEPIYKTAERLMRVEEGTTLGIEAHAIPLHDVIVGDETHPPTKELIDETLQVVKDLSFKSEYVHPPWIRVSQLESFSLAKIPLFMQPFITAIAAATGVPEFILLGRGEGTNKATAQAMVRFVHQTIEPLQNKMGMFFEEEILAPLMDLHKIQERPSIEWNEIIPTDRTSAADIVKGLSPLLFENKPLLSWEEAREIMGLGKSADFKGGSELKVLDAIYLTVPHGEMIWKDEKKAIVKAKPFEEKTEQDLYLASGNAIYGIINLNKPVKIDLKQFTSLRRFHKISEEEREDWWPQAKDLYYFRFKFKKFPEPKKFKLPKGAQTFIKEVNLSDAYLTKGQENL